MPPRASRVQEGPNDAFAIGKTGTKIPYQEDAVVEDDGKKKEAAK